MRFLIHSEEYGEYAYRNYIILLLIFTAYSIFCVIFRFELFSFSNKIKTRNAWSAIEIVLDTIFITMFYMINGKVDSDFFLFYYLPLLTSAQYFGINVYLITFVCISMSYISAIYVISMSDTSVFFGNSLLRVFLGREIFFLLVSGAVVYLLHNARHQNRYVEKIQKALDNAFSGIEKLPKLNQSIDQFLRTLVDDYRCEYATVSLVDEQRNTITSFRGINTPLGWIERSAYDLESEDITARTARLGRRSKIMSGWSEYFNREIYDRFQHNLLARVFIPLLSDSKSIGALEVGCNVDRKEAVFTDENIANIEGLATRYGPILDENRPHKILKSIAEEAMKIIDADSASIHIFAGPIEKFVAGAGRAEPSFLKQLPRRPVGGLGAKALRSDKPRWIDDPSELRAKNPALFEAGVRAICAIPLGLQGHHMEGVLYLHFWQPHIFDFIEIDIERVYAREISWIIRTLTDFAKLDEEGKRAKAITDLHNIVFSVTADADPTEALEEIARQALYLLDADSIHLYTLSSTMNNAVATVGSVPEVSSTGTRPQKKEQVDLLNKLSTLPEIIFVQNIENANNDVLKLLEDASVDHFRAHGIRSYIAIKLQRKNSTKSLGFLIASYSKMLVWCDSFRDSSIAIKAAASNAVRTFELHHQISSAQKLAIYQVGHNILGRIGYMRGEILSLQQELNALQSVQLNDISKKNIYRAVDGCKNGMNLLVKDLDDLKKLDPYGKLDKKPIDLPQLLERVVRSCASDLANDKIHEIVLNTFPAIIYGDYRKLSDAFIELVNNASKAIKRNLHHHQDHKVDITLTKDSKNYLSIIITDTGTGVSEDVRERIFLPYATTEGSNGSGMGLPIVKDIVEKHRGTVILDSTFRKGARFVVKFPPSIFNKPVEE